NYILKKNKEIKFKFNIISKNFINNKIENKKNLKILKFNKDVTKLYKNIQIAISSVGNTSFELGRIGIPSIHYTLEKREIKRAKNLNNLNLGIYVNKDNMIAIINELNKIYFNDNYRNKLVENRKRYFKKKNILLKIIQNEI
ncbi:glycosyltransferase, partial [Candidatus Pelagibacter sp.]|uniref:glycosyltransferase n=1 Tax=Candidatus Pelagibacter sp. TaxID=2024849 RepID=UPI003F82527D